MRACVNLCVFKIQYTPAMFVLNFKKSQLGIFCRRFWIRKMKTRCSARILRPPRRESVCMPAMCFQHPHACLFQIVTAFSRKVASPYFVQTLSEVIHSILDGPVMELDVADGVDVSYQVLILGGKCAQVFHFSKCCKCRVSFRAESHSSRSSSAWLKP